MTEVLSMNSENASIPTLDNVDTSASKMQLKLSDIIFILSPENEIFHNKTFFIDYRGGFISKFSSLEKLPTHHKNDVIISNESTWIKK